jgi:hypothetical protein
MSTDPMPIPAPEPQPVAKISPFGRIIGIFFSPKPTFQDIVRKPTWILPLGILIITGLLLNISLAFHANWLEVTKEQIAKSKLASSQFDRLDDAQKEKAYTDATARQKIMRYVRGIIGWPLLLLIATLLYFGAYRLIGGGRISFMLSFVIIVYAHLPLAIREILGSLVVMLKDPTQIDPENYLASNLAALVGSNLPQWQQVPLAFLDLFGIWVIILLAIGFSAADPKKLPFGKSIGIAVGVNVFLIAFFTSIAWAFS